MHLNRRNALTALATTGALAALGVTATPMLPIWLNQGETPLPAPATALNSSADTCFLNSPNVVVDLADNVSEADIRDINTRFGLNLQFNSPESRDEKLMVAPLNPGTDAAQALQALRNDPRVEVAEQEQFISIPEVSAAAAQWSPQAVVNGTARTAIFTSTAGHVTLRLTDGEVVSVAMAPVRPESEQRLPSSAFLSRTPKVAPEFTDLYSPQHPYTRYGRTYAAFRPNDPRYGEQWNFQMVGAEGAWKHTRGKGVVVAVLDTGVSGPGSKRGTGCRDFSETTFVEGYDFVHNDKDPYDDHGHGTHVAGTIAESTNNNEGVAGLAFEASIMPVKVLAANGSGSSADIADAIRFAADKGANVINMSLGSAYPSDVIHSAVKYARKKGVTIVCAAGNSFREGVGYPAAYPECIAVSSVGPSGQLAKYSSWGKQVALAAPGGDMIDSGNPADGILQNTNYPESQGGRGDDYYAFQGTSMASPHVAAAAALVVATGVKDPAKVREVLTQTATPAGDKAKYGAGILSASNAAERATRLNGIKLRHMLVFGLGFLMLAVGGAGRLPGIRVSMVAALALGFFGPDWFTNLVGADSAWNLLGFSAAAPVIAYALLRRGPGVKIAGVLGLATAVGLWANLHNGSLPFTSATFGQTPMLWVWANTAGALVVGGLAAMKAHRATRRIH